MVTHKGVDSVKPTKPFDALTGGNKGTEQLDALRREVTASREDNNDNSDAVRNYSQYGELRLRGGGGRKGRAGAERRRGRIYADNFVLPKQDPVSQTSMADSSSAHQSSDTPRTSAAYDASQFSDWLVHSQYSGYRDSTSEQTGFDQPDNSHQQTPGPGSDFAQTAHQSSDRQTTFAAHDASQYGDWPPPGGSSAPAPEPAGFNAQMGFDQPHNYYSTAYDIPQPQYKDRGDDRPPAVDKYLAKAQKQRDEYDAWKSQRETVAYAGGYRAYGEGSSGAIATGSEARSARGKEREMPGTNEELRNAMEEFVANNSGKEFTLNWREVKPDSWRVSFDGRRYEITGSEKFAAELLQNRLEQSAERGYYTGAQHNSDNWMPWENR